MEDVIYHKIRALLYDNPLTEDPNDLIARVISERSLNIRDVCVIATKRGGADISASAMEHAVDLWFKEMGYQLCDGYSINTGYFTAGAEINGVFNTPDEKFNKKKHKLFFGFRQGEIMRKELENVTVEIMGLADVMLNISQVVDVKTGSVNEFITPDRNLKISGNKIKVVGDHPDNGVFFLDDQENRIPVDMSDMVVNNPSELIFVIPAFPSGMRVKVGITTQYRSSGSSMLKEPRTCIFDKILVVGIKERETFATGIANISRPLTQ